jgi:hypothetical protein
MNKAPFLTKVHVRDMYLEQERNVASLYCWDFSIEPSFNMTYILHKFLSHSRTDDQNHTFRIWVHMLNVYSKTFLQSS